MAYQDRRAKAEQLEIMRDRIKKEIDTMARWGAHVDAAVAKARASLEELRKALAKAGA